MIKLQIAIFNNRLEVQNPGMLLFGFTKAGMKIEELCRKYGIARGTFYAWRTKFGDMKISDAQRLRSLESENSKLKRLVAEQALDIITLKDVVSRKW
jgi:putative transposase